jgi:hypothetical protein
MTVELSSSVSSDDWEVLKASQDKIQIVTMLRHRYEERYFEPFRNNPSKHGFSMMAVSCLVIESLYSLMKGWKRTNGSGAVVFESFFSSSIYLREFTGLGGEFYKNIRCGILHQAETTNGWRIRRDCCQLLDKENKIIHATKFLDALELEFNGFLEQLRQENFQSIHWQNVIRKIDYIVANCG